MSLEIERMLKKAAPSPRAELNVQAIKRRASRAWIARAIGGAVFSTMLVAAVLLAGPRLTDWIEQLRSRSIAGEEAVDQPAPPTQSATGPVFREGTVYVLSVEDLKQKVVAINPAGLGVVATYDVGYDPSAVLSPDGKRLYVTDSPQGTLDYDLKVIDSRTGEVIQRSLVPNRWRGTYQGASPVMAMSDDGNRLFIRQDEVVDGQVQYGVTTYDPQANAVLPDVAATPNCGASLLLPIGQNEVVVVCSSNEVFFLQISESGAASETTKVSLPAVDTGVTDPNGNVAEVWRPAWATLSPSRETLYVVSEGGSVHLLDIPTRSLTRTVDLGIPQDLTVGTNEGVLAPDGKRMYVGFERVGDQEEGGPSEVGVYDTEDWKLVGKIHSSDAIWSMAVSPTGLRLYGLSLDADSMLVFDTASLAEVGRFEQKGIKPALADVAD